MIIPPDPEKDPNIFSATSSTPSLFPPPSDTDSEDAHDPTHPGTIAVPSRAHTRNTNAAYGYPFSYADDLGVGYNGEALPPYRRSSVDSTSNLSPDPPFPGGAIATGSSVSAVPAALNYGGGPAPAQMRERNQRIVTVPGIIIPPPPAIHDDETTPTARTAATGESGLPFTTDQTASSTGSTAKLWEGSGTQPKKWSAPSMTPAWARWWKKYKKWVYIALGVFLAGLGMMIGLLVGLKAGAEKKDPTPGVPWKDISGDKRQTWVSTGESLNVTYNPQRDGPFPQDGSIVNCPAFRPLNATSPSLLLSRPFPAVGASVANFDYALWKNGSSLQILPDFTFIARGLGASGTVEIVGTDAPPEVLADGREGVMRVEVIALYSGQQDLEDIVRVCELSRGDDGVGLGVFTPQETDGKVNNAYMLNPTSLPSFHIIVHLPPSAVTQPSHPTIGIPSLEFELDRMAVRFGDLQNVVDFGNINVTSGRGGVDAVYVGAERVDIRTGENTVRGRWNITESLIVNNTEGSIIAEVIVHDPNVTDLKPALESPFSRRSLHDQVARGYSGDERVVVGGNTSHVEADGNPSNGTTDSDDDDDDNQHQAATNGTSTNSSSTPTPKRVVNTWFMTAEGILAVAYIYQAPTVSLSGLFQNNQGDTSISVHPNYVGPFVIKDIWGQVRVPPPAPINESDPMNQWRSRSITFGQVDIAPNGIYTDNGLNNTILENSTVALSGAAYWRGEETRTNGTLTPQEVQGLEESDDQILVLGAWGNIAVTFDGR